MRHQRPFGFMGGKRLFNRIAIHGCSMGNGDHIHRGRIWIRWICGQFLGSCRLHPQRQGINPRKRAVYKNNDAVTRLNGRDHAIQTAPPRASHAKCIGVFRSPNCTQHMFAFDHSVQHIRMHVIGQTRTGELL